LERRVQWTFSILVILAVSAMGALSAALAARPSPTIGIAVAASGIVPAGSIALALWIWLVLWSRRR